MNFRKLSAAFVGLIMAVSFNANAGLIYDNGGSIGGGIANNSTDWVQADDFMLLSDEYISGGGIWIESQSGSFNWDGTLEYWFFDALSPSGVIQTGFAINVVQVDTGILAQGGVDNIQKIEFDFDSLFAALSNTNYYLGVRLGSQDVAWSGFTPGNGVESSGGSFNNWSNNSRERAFYLESKATTVPEPSTLAILALGIMGLASRRFKK